jgi:guanylate kinase
MNEQEICPNSPGQPGTHRGNHNRGHLLVVSAPSGAGKTTLCHALLEHFTDMIYSVSYTTRSPRKGEKDAVDYHFISLEEFKNGIIDRKWAEWAEVHGHYYGTSAELLDKGLSAGKDILADLDVQGTIQILARYPDCISIFIAPPSLETLRHRLESRGLDSATVIEQRLRNAKDEMAKKDLYRHVIVNDRLKEAKKQLISLIQKYCCSVCK